MSSRATPIAGAPTPEALARALGLHPPTPEQARIIAHPLSPLLVVAGAGSGKTATMSQRVVHLVARGDVTADRVLGLTFTRRATAELAQRVTARLGRLAASGLAPAPEEAPEPTVSTYNAFAGSLVRDHGLRIGVDPDSTLITEARAWQIVSDMLQARTEPLPVDTLSTAVRTVLALDSALSENLLDVDRAAEGLEELADLFEGLAAVRGLKTSFGRPSTIASQRLGMLQVVSAYREHKRRHGLLSFGDQIALACRIAEGVPEAAEQVRAQYSAVLLDEFQDTSVAQARLLSALFAGGGVTAVGDPNQAIYGWRGASAGALDEFHTRFNPDGAAAVRSGAIEADDPAGTPVLPLSTAWRNDRAVLAAANAVSEPLRRHLPQAGDARVAHLPVEELRARPACAGLAEGRVLATRVADPLAEAEAVADFMAERWSPTAELAVLARVRSAFPVLAEALEARGIPCEVVGLGGMLTVPEVADVRALITVAADPERGDRLMRLLTAARIGAADLRALSSLAAAIVRGSAPAPGAGRSADAQDEEAAPLLAEAIEEIARRADAAPGGVNEVTIPGLTSAGVRAADRVARAVRRVRAVLALPLAEVVIAAEQALGLDIELAARVGDRLGRRALDAFRAAAERYTADMETPGVADFLGWLDAAAEHERGLETPEVDPEPGAVQILTIHAAKGLEWDHVAVVGMAEGVFPGYSARPVDDLSVRDWSWLTGLDELPHPLRADAGTLPPFELGALEPAVVAKEEAKDLLESYRLALGRHTLTEERRLAYVAITRARHDLLLAAGHFSGGASRPRPVSRFLAELRRRGLVEPWGEGFTELAPDAVNRLADRTVTARWPEAAANDDMARARAAAADAVRAAAAAGRSARDADPPGASEDPVVRRWREEAVLLLAERTRSSETLPVVRMPSHLPATRLDDLRADPDAFALGLRRPLPPRPREAGRLGTVFHEAVAQRLAEQGQLLSLARAGVPLTLGDADRRRLERWLEVVEGLPLLAGYVLQDTETELGLTLGATTLRCRLDAVFRGSDGTWLIVDWKTGRRPVPVDQLSVYVHALAASRGVGTQSVRAAYVYVDLPDHPDGFVDELGGADLLTLSEIEASLAVGADAGAGPSPHRLDPDRDSE